MPSLSSLQYYPQSSNAQSSISQEKQQTVPPPQKQTNKQSQEI